MLQWTVDTDRRRHVTFRLSLLAALVISNVPENLSKLTEVDMPKAVSFTATNSSTI
jgi:hypothetical protein